MSPEHVMYTSDSWAPKKGTSGSFINSDYKFIHYIKFVNPPIYSRNLQRPREYYCGLHL